MDNASLLKSLLTVVIAYLLKLALTTIGVPMDEVMFNTIVAAIVIYFMTLFGYSATVRAALFFQNRK